MIPFFLILAGVYFFDLLSKMIVRAKMPIGTEINVLPFFSWVHVKNTGIAFGMFPEKNYLFLGLGVVVTCFMIFYALRLLKQDRASSLTLALVLGGALGNLTDRIRFGEVTDFLDFFWGPHHWPAFNVADSAICVGAALLLYRSLCSRSS